MSHLSLRSEARQTQTLTPRLQHAVRLLQMSSLDYERELHETAARNPFLDAEDGHCEAHAEPAQPAQTWAGDSPPRELPIVGPDEGAAREPEHDAPWERDSWLHAMPSSHGGDSPDGGSNPMELMAAVEGLGEHLHRQANVLPLSERDRLILRTLIESLDDDGYLRLELGDIARAVDLVPPAEDCELNTALRLVQSFDPAGIGARDIAECLLLQLEQAEIEDRSLAREILCEHIERLARRDVAGLARRLHRSPEEVHAACSAIRRLDPRPGWRFGRPDVHYIVPDVVVRKTRGRWIAQLNPAVVPRVRLNRVYADLFRQHRESRHGELAAHLQEARWTLRNVEQRFSTILAVSQAIVGRQQLFLEHGSFAMKPLGLKDIADEVGVHESTVCRVTNNKYMATPGGVYELKHFFSRAMPMSSGGACSAIAIRGVIGEMIDGEDARDPLSDVDIAHRLARQGLTVARRTVTKYRQMLKLPAIEQRREPPADA
jgi:RNA polymerase sigma-54 factor